jgi:biopolymer transport protein ExbD
MPKIKIPRKNVSLDMTAMCDVAFLLLSFFMLTTTFKPEEAKPVDTPSSVSEIPLPDKDNVVITIGKDGDVFFGVDGDRVSILKRVAEARRIPFTKEQEAQFAALSAHGVSIQELPGFLNYSVEDRRRYLAEKNKEYLAKKGRGVQIGVPVDTVAEKNELRDWVSSVVQEGRRMHYVIKGDGTANYQKVKWVISTLQDFNINRFNLITSLERAPSSSSEKK